MYLIVDEDNSVTKTATLHPYHIEAHKEGINSIIWFDGDTFYEITEFQGDVKHMVLVPDAVFEE